MPAAPPRPLSRALIAEHAIELVDGGGELTVRGLAKKLGVAAPSLYHHVRGKDEIIGLVREAMHSSLVLEHGGGWRQQSKRMFEHLRAFYAKHPTMPAHFVTVPISTDDVLELYERVAREYAAAGFTPRQTALALEMLESFTLGVGLEYGAPAMVWEAREDDSALRAFASAYPTEAQKIDEAFERGIEFLLDGIARELGAGSGAAAAGSAAAGPASDEFR